MVRSRNDVDVRWHRALVAGYASSDMRPNRLIVRAYLSRTARLWLGARALLCGVSLLAGMNPVPLSAGAAVEIVLLSVGLSVLETHRRRERALLSNLGIGPFALGALFVAPAMIGELALHVGGAAFR